MLQETIRELSKRAGEAVAAEFDGTLSDVPFDQMGKAIAALIERVMLGDISAA
jgi:hypothetical protein